MGSKGGERKPRVLFITRKFPPSVGGMERLSYELITNMRKRLDCSAITWGRSQKYLFFFLPIAFIKSALHLSSGKYDLVHVGDALLCPLGLLLKRIFRVPVAINLHGLDMTFPNRFYQWMIRSCLPRLDLFICISGNTRDIALKKGVPMEKTCVIECGIQIDTMKPPADRDGMRHRLEQRLERNIDGKKILVTVGRLVKRKGVGQFIGTILPNILRAYPNLLYLVVGEGDEEEEIRKRIARNGLEDKVLLLGRIRAGELEDLYGASDLFVMPNIVVEGDVEGFGIVAIEASLAGLPVVAFGIEGIRDAIANGENGFLIEPGEDDAFASAVIDLLRNDEKRKSMGERGKRFTEIRFSWEPISRKYTDAFRACVDSRSPGPEMSREIETQ